MKQQDIDTKSLPFNQNQWHWAFYSFEEDAWDKMDYEMGDEKVNWGYWEKYGKCEKIKFQNKKCYALNKKHYKRNKIFKVLKNNLSSR